MYTDATISEDGKYRYTLDRVWGVGSVLGWIMLNPSTANAHTDDPTVRECVSLARRWNYTGITVRNLFAYRATHFADLKTACDTGTNVVGPENWSHVLSMAQKCNKVILAWGSKGGFLNMDDRMMAFLKNENVNAQLMCLGTTNAHMPVHPLGRIGPIKLEPYTWKEI